jgi:hypothetical protein
MPSRYRAFSILLFLTTIAGSTASAQSLRVDPRMQASTRSGDTTRYHPRFFGSPSIQCIEQGKTYLDSLGVADSDLVILSGVERLQLRVIEPAGFDVVPATIQGPLAGDSMMITVSSQGVNLSPGKHRIVLVVSDVAGRSDTLPYYISVSRPVEFLMPITVSSQSLEFETTAYQTLYFGLDATGKATTGSEPESQGRLDAEFCEYELPPLPPQEIFDARWSIVTRNGILRNIYPDSASIGTRPPSWNGVVSINYVDGTAPRYSWSMIDAARSPYPLTLTDQTGKLFAVNMKTGDYMAENGITVEQQGDMIHVQTTQKSSLTGFHITQDEYTSSVTDDERWGMEEGRLVALVPNPFSARTTIDYVLTRRERVSIEIIDLQGKLVRKLSDDTADPGEHRIDWDGTDQEKTPCASGTYLCRVSTGGRTMSRKVVLLR